MSPRPYVHMTDAELTAAIAKFRPYKIEALRRLDAAELEGRVRRLEGIAADLQQDLPAGALSDDRLKKKVDRLSGRVSSVATTADVAASRAFALTRELQAEVAERKADRDRIQQRVTNLELRNSQNPR
jgi:hypothetical protein